MIDADRRSSICSIVIFAVLVNALAWVGPLLGGDPTAPGPGLLVWGTAPIASALLMKWMFRDDVSLGFRPSLRGNGRWYVLSILIYPFTITLIMALGSLLGITRLNDFTATALMSALAPIIVIYFLFALFEETGWRGYLTPDAWQRMAWVVRCRRDRALRAVLGGALYASRRGWRLWRRTDRRTGSGGTRSSVSRERPRAREG